MDSVLVTRMTSVGGALKALLGLCDEGLVRLIGMLRWFTRRRCRSLRPMFEHRIDDIAGASEVLRSCFRGRCGELSPFDKEIQCGNSGEGESHAAEDAII